MDQWHITRHTRRGFLRGKSVVKFWAVPAALSTETNIVGAACMPPGSAGRMPALPGVEAACMPPTADDLDFCPEPDSRASAILVADYAEPQPITIRNDGPGFLSWLAEKIAEQADNSANKLAAHNRSDVDDQSLDDFDPHARPISTDESLLTSSDDLDQDLSYALEGSVGKRKKPEHSDSHHLSAKISRGRKRPKVEIVDNGVRLESFAEGSSIVKDVLGRVIEVHSKFGDSVFFRYGELGTLDGFERVAAKGSTHSGGTRDKHGVVVRDKDGRVKALGQCMTVDPKGRFYLHSVDGQYFSVDLVSGVHSERRLIAEDSGQVRFVTALFTHDGFRMATMFGPGRMRADTAGGGEHRDARFRFYGRDGSMIEFSNYEDLSDLRPSHVGLPATRGVDKGWLRSRQANTAWASVHEYLMRS